VKVGREEKDGQVNQKEMGRMVGKKRKRGRREGGCSSQD
jgi:hypothetical protein